MADFEEEKLRVLHLLSRLGLDGSVSDPKPKRSSPETGIDVIVHLADGQIIGVQVTEIDPHTTPSKARAREKKVAGSDPGKVYFDWAQNDSQVVLDSLVRSVSKKVAIADQHSFEAVKKVWLLICSGIPQHGAAVSTFVMTPWLSAGDVNQATDSLLQKSKYNRCFFLPIHGAEQALYSWEKDGGWTKSVKPDDPRAVPRDAYVNSLKRAATAGDWQEVHRIYDEEFEAALSECGLR